MDYELITVREYWGNNLESTREAKQYSDGRIELVPLPDYPPDEEEMQECEDNEND
jgi:hypothetical protein